jgi:3-hydroxyisobutyrate dehydrogenase-like beta-hydroxyacid dehydrogenase
VTQTARECGIETPAADLALDRFNKLVDAGGGEKDHSALRTLLKVQQPVGG